MSRLQVNNLYEPKIVPNALFMNPVFANRNPQNIDDLPSEEV
jgi:hypothetical protein